jgi:hypothetical protein
MLVINHGHLVVFYKTSHTYSFTYSFTYKSYIEKMYTFVILMTLSLLIGAFMFSLNSELFGSPRQNDTWSVKYVDPKSMDSSQFAGSGPTCAKISDTQCAMNPLYPFST